MRLIARWTAVLGPLAMVASACGGSSGILGGAAGMPGRGGTPGLAGSGGSTGGAGFGGSGGSTGGAGFGGSGGSTGGAGSGGSAVPGGGAGGAAVGGSGGLPSGTCGIFQRIPLADVPIDGSADIWRVNAGFTVGPWRETLDTGQYRLRWLRVDAAGAAQAYASAAGFSVAALATFNMADANRVLLIQNDGFSAYWTALMDEQATSSTLVGKLLDGTYSKFSFVVANFSLDEQRGLLMNAEVAGHPPWLAMFAADGTAVGHTLQLPAEGACYSVFPTAHGDAFSSVEGSTFHLIEIGADGGTALDVKVPLVRASPMVTACPVVALTDAGFATLAFETTDAYGDGWTLHRIARDGTATVESWATLLGCNAVTLAIQGNAAIAACSQTNQTTIVKRTNGQDQRFALEQTGPQIHSEAGSLFVDVTHLLAAAPSPRREIFEIRCAN